MTRRLKVGAARNVITPALGAHIAGYFEDRIAEDIHDDLYAKAIVLESGETALAVVVCDLVGLHLAQTNRARELAAEKTGIPPESILIAATHTHFGPSPKPGENMIDGIDYAEWLPGRIADAVRMAQNRLRPALAAHTAGVCTEEAHNRRYRMKDGSVVTNPGYGNPNVVEPAGPIDPAVGLIAFLDEELAPIALLANYALHYVGGEFGAVGSLRDGHSAVDTSITADYFGAFDRAMSRMAGADFVSIMMNGCAGDINNIDVFGPPPEYPHPWYQIERVADVVAATAFKAWRGIPVRAYDSSPQLAAATDRFVFRRRTFSAEEIEASQRQLADSRPQSLGDREWLHARTVIRLSEQPLERETRIQALRIGETAIVGLPGEIFVEIGLEIKQRSPFPRTLVGELANDSPGYIPTPKAFEEGSYEVYTTPASPETAPAVIESTLRLLKGISG